MTGRMIQTSSTTRIPGCLLALLAVYCAASLIHFVHNARFIADYPNLPAWLTSAKVYLAWLAVTAVGAAGMVFFKFGRRLPGLVLIAGYAALGFAGLDHYSLAPVSAHTVAMNATIGFEVLAAAGLFTVSVTLLFRLDRQSAAGQ
jgi:hypothetical protein